jgi:hypothetical protein
MCAAETRRTGSFPPRTQGSGLDLAQYSRERGNTVATDEEVYAARDRAVERLLPLPGVTAVGVGGRERGGEPLDELVVRVYVEVKKPPEEVPPDQLIPAEIDGVPTDVAEMGYGRLLQAPEEPGKQDIPLKNLDENKRRPLTGGSRIQSDLFGTSSGTLGLFLVDDTDPTKVYAVTNWHVLQGANEDPTKGRTKAGQPTGSDGCSGCCSDLIGTVAGGGMDSARDVGVVRLDAGTQWLAEIFWIGPVRGSHPITPQEAGATPRPQVRKRGIRSGLTGGFVECVGATVTLDGGAQVHNVILVKPNPDPRLPAGTQLHFVQGGDSGSALVNQAGEVVGLVFAEATKPAAERGKGWALPIGRLATATDPAIPGVLTSLQSQDQLKLKVATATTAGDVRTVPGAAMVPVPPELVPGLTGGDEPAREPMMVPAARSWLPGIAPPSDGDLAHLRADLDRSRAGRLLATVWEHHGRELLRLVDTDRRVAAGWHRNGGSALLQMLIRMVRQPALALPGTVHGVPLATCLDRLRDVFAPFGSASLRADLERARAALPDVAGLTYPQIIEAFGTD